ncbi:hypothetical protein [Persicirhabdus sediminis]|uniref:hypothetical protein n=1 Tax=Persicirhabdus sediminis TaxID=454144 RepID=UPI001F2798EA|nr:hypothetical protein [Persicirhabdus sediminis]
MAFFHRTTGSIAKPGGFKDFSSGSTSPSECNPWSARANNDLPEAEWTVRLKTSQSARLTLDEKLPHTQQKAAKDRRTPEPSADDC